jgi:hypothetical protein
VSDTKKSRRATVYVDPWPLAVLAVDADTAGVRYALRALAGLVAEAGRGLATILGEMEWALLYAALADEVERAPDPGEDWASKVQFAVDAYAEATYSGCMADPQVADALGESLCRVLRNLGDIPALAILASVRHAKRLADEGVAPTGRWWEVSVRTRG